MKRARFTGEQIIAVLREHEAGAKTADLAHRYGISEATLYEKMAMMLLGQAQCDLRSCARWGP
jgi:hypothetical protein